MSGLSKENELVSASHRWVCPKCGKFEPHKKDWKSWHFCMKTKQFETMMDTGSFKMNWFCHHGLHIYHCTGTGWQDSWGGTSYQTCNSRECLFCHKSQHAKSVTISGQGLYGYRGWEDDD
jgi:hypothetical protein